MAEYTARAWEIATDLTRPYAPSEALVELAGKLHRQCGRRVAIAVLELCNGDKRKNFATEGEWQRCFETMRDDALESGQSIANLMMSLPADRLTGLVVSQSDLYAIVERPNNRPVPIS